MFGKGTRFPPQKVSDVPGPGAYNPTTESQLDAYKRGAFLEKADRFNKEQESDIPGPGTYNTDPKPPTAAARPPSRATKPAATQQDRYAILQRKLDDLEKIHADGKKAHQAEVDRLKLELSKHQRASGEHDKLKKSHDSLNAHFQELKKTTASQQSEIKDLRTKLRLAESERTQFASKQHEAGDAQKALHSAEARRREEAREKDRKIGELERALAMEKKKRETAEGRWNDVRGKVDGQVEEAKKAMRDVEERLRATEAEKDDLEERAEDLLQQLDDMRVLVSRVAEEYAKLKANSVERRVYDGLKRESLSLQVRLARMERKLGNSEAQVVELAFLVRQTKEENGLLTAAVRDAEEEVAFYSQALREAMVKCEQASTPPEDRILEEDVLQLGEDIRANRETALTARVSSLKRFNWLNTLLYDELLFFSSHLDHSLKASESQIEAHVKQLANAESARQNLASEMQSLRAQNETALAQVAELKRTFNDLKHKEEQARRQTEEVKTQKKRSDELLKNEREAVARLTSLYQQSKMAEEAFQADIDQLTHELAEAEQYHDAYYNLVEQANALIARNELAEEEAEHLSKFNAEILSHQNPQQRIMYLDKIRRELAETKQKLLMTNLDLENVLAENQTLRNELDMYTSVMVHPENKPRTAITRVTRVPLSSQNQNARPNARVTALSNSRKQIPEEDFLQDLEEHIPQNEDLTLDELM